MVKIISVEKRSVSEKLGILPGDLLVSINENKIRDVLDYRFYLTEKKVKLELIRDGESYTAEVKKGEYQDIGLSFETPLMDKKHSCHNKCIFCFIDQNPEGMRETIYFKDDDSRLSFIHGNYVTLTNMKDEDIERIVKMRLSPINISIHTTNPQLRVKMMKNKRAGEVLRYLDVLFENGISMCGQIVLCKGVNDGEELLRTMRDLSKYFPHLSSVSVVPAGLTKHREGLFPLADFTAEEAESIIDMIDSFANECKEKFSSRIFFAADEFYLKAKRPIPSAEYYEEYPQIENGVGMIRSFSDDFDFATEDISDMIDSLSAERSIGIATGALSYPMICDMANRIMALTNKIKIKVFEIKNRFFGESITVSGLLTGKDILEQLLGKIDFDELFVPANALRYPEMDFLCGMKLSELEDRLSVKVKTAGQDGFEFLEALFGIN